MESKRYMAVAFVVVLLALALPISLLGWIMRVCLVSGGLSIVFVYLSGLLGGGDYE